jgi:hypothetical protein
MKNIIIVVAVVLGLGILGYVLYPFVQERFLAENAEVQEGNIGEVVIPTEPEDTVFDETLAAELAGSWRSLDDEQFVRSFTAEGMMMDTYTDEEGDVVSTGSWGRVSTDAPILASFGSPDVPVIKIVFEPVLTGGEGLDLPVEENLYFSVVFENQNTLSMVYLNGNGVLRFTRI